MIQTAHAGLLLADTLDLSAKTVKDVDVTPGVIGFVVMAIVAVVTILLIVDMMRRVRRTRYRSEIRERLEAEAAEDEAAGGTAEAEAAEQTGQPDRQS